MNDRSLKEIHRSSQKRIYEALESIGSVIARNEAIQNLPIPVIPARPLAHEMSLGSTPEIHNIEQDFSATLRNDKKSDISINVDFILGLPYTLPGETLE